MNTALKHWREAATVILTAGIRHKPSVEPLKPALQKISDVGQNSAFDYQVLLLKRSGKSGFMPNAYVFPGGLVDPTDFSSEWQEVFKAFAGQPNYGLGVVRQLLRTRPPMFATDRAKLGSPIPGDVAFRICAVRETFEESGVLLVVPKQQQQPQKALTELSGRWASDVLSEWRSKVIDNPANFIQMCRELECLPNIWALHEWGNWLTPTDVPGRRYDTAFYLCCLNETPHTLQDQKEIVHFKWSSPIEVLRSYKAKNIWIAPPQFYDLSRVCHFPAIGDLHHFAQQRSLEGCEQWMPVRFESNHGYVSLLPGDGLYPENVDTSGKNGGVVTADAQDNSSNLHRIVAQDPYKISVHVNISPRYKHLSPMSSEALDESLETRSQL